MIKVKGLDKLTRDLDQAQKALSQLEDELGTVSFNPNDPASIESAIQHAEALVDERLGEYSLNPIIGPLAEQMKAAYRDGIVGKAAEARLGSEANDE
ncbi:hypothetical protein BV511_06560 [Methylorubrum extorquens]|uniref:hypothetical protein n=1 Tax=Methylorubrum extorquens TaxID=408 RepID=UPI000972E7CF|nr:hypothetical protein [Methylorubrum extorquens]APX84411.1 hypothetical protein BV511_06560 [Methylorubrum extorquens]